MLLAATFGRGKTRREYACTLVFQRADLKTFVSVWSGCDLTCEKTDVKRNFRAVREMRLIV